MTTILNIFDLKVGDQVTVNTQNTKYVFIVKEVSTENPKFSFTSSNEKYPGASSCFILGTGGGPNPPALHAFAVGGCLNIVVGSKLITTSPVISVVLNGDIRHFN